MGLSARLNDDARRTVAQGMLNEFVDVHVKRGIAYDGSSFYLLRNNPEANDIELLGVAFGRALGLALLHDADVSYAKLPLMAAKTLFHSERLLCTTIAEALEQIEKAMPQLFEASLGIIGGLEETLGPGGPQLFSLTDWMNRFGHNGYVFRV